MTHHPHPPFSSGPWTVHPALKTLSSDGQEVRVGHKVMAVLVCLVQADGELVTKDQLVERVWQGAFTTDEAVATVVYELRKALGDDARRPSFVETIRQGGYRWLAEVAPLRPPVRRLPPPRHAVVWALGLAAALLLVFGVISLLPTAKGEVLASPSGSSPVAKTIDPRAEEAYDLGSYFLRQGTPVSNRKAQDYFLQAIERQPAFAAAHAGLASSFVASTEGLTGMASSEAFRQARESARTALAIDDELAAAHASLANVSFRHAWDWRAAEDHFRRGLAAADQALEQTQDYAFYLAAMGRHGESVSVMQRVVAAEPTSKHARWALGRVYYLARRFDEALVELAWARELDTDTGLLARTILDEPVVLCRMRDGLPVAFADRCPHRSLPLSAGTITEDGIRCGYHGLEFDRAGVCIRVPGQDRIPPDARVRCYPVVEKWRWIWIWMGEPDQADEALIPDYHWNDDPDWLSIGDRFHVRGGYRLLVDNLLDLSHVQYIHASTLGTEAVVKAAICSALSPARRKLSWHAWIAGSA